MLGWVILNFNNLKVYIMKKFIITIVPAVALLVGCGKVPLACESDGAKNAVQRIISKTTNIPAGLYTASFEQVITQSINDKKEQTCKATVTYSLTEEAKNTLIEATVKLDESLVVHPGGYPTIKYLPNATSVAWYFDTPSDDESVTLYLLGGTDYHQRLQDYLLRIAQDETHPDHLGFLVYSAQIQKIYEFSKSTEKVYDNALNHKYKFEIGYKTTIIKVDGKEEYYTEGVVPGDVRSALELAAMYNKVAKKILAN